jgi:hypothetical protein
MEYLVILYNKYNEKFIEYIDRKILANNELVTKLETLLGLGGYYTIKKLLTKKF